MENLKEKSDMEVPFFKSVSDQLEEMTSQQGDYVGRLDKLLMCRSVVMFSLHPHHYPAIQRFVDVTKKC